MALRGAVVDLDQKSSVINNRLKNKVGSDIGHLATALQRKDHRIAQTDKRHGQRRLQHLASLTKYLALGRKQGYLHNRRSPWTFATTEQNADEKNRK